MQAQNVVAANEVKRGRGQGRDELESIASFDVTQNASKSMFSMMMIHLLTPPLPLPPSTLESPLSPPSPPLSPPPAAPNLAKISLHLRLQEDLAACSKLLHLKPMAPSSAW